MTGEELASAMTRLGMTPAGLAAALGYACATPQQRADSARYIRDKIALGRETVGTAVSNRMRILMLERGLRSAIALSPGRHEDP